MLYFIRVADSAWRTSCGQEDTAVTRSPVAAACASAASGAGASSS